MSAVSLVYGQKTDITIYGNDDIVDATFTVTNSDDSNTDFTGLLTLTLTVYDERGGTQLAQIVKDSGLTYSANVITLDADYSVDFALLELNETYYCELAWTNASSNPLTISYGDWKVI
jgi:hypothetical protein